MGIHRGAAAFAGALVKVGGYDFQGGLPLFYIWRAARGSKGGKFNRRKVVQPVRLSFFHLRANFLAGFAV